MHTHTLLCNMNALKIRTISTAYLAVKYKGYRKFYLTLIEKKREYIPIQMHDAQQWGSNILLKRFEELCSSSKVFCFLKEQNKNEKKILWKILIIGM